MPSVFTKPHFDRMKPDKKYNGVIVPMITPFDEQLQIDSEATERILQSFLDQNISPFLLGTTGESVSIPRGQQSVLVKTTTRFCGTQVKVYAGISGNVLEESIDAAIEFADMGVTAVVAHLPFYYPMDADQMTRYYEKLADQVPVPLILYNNPITTKFSVPLEVIEKLSYHENIAGVKDSERGMERLQQSLNLWSNRSDFVHLTGWAAQSAFALLNGSDGIIPSTGNVVPELYASLYKAAISGDAAKANELQELTNQISDIYQKDRNVSQSIPALKIMMSTLGICKPHVLPPMFGLNNEEIHKIKELTKNILHPASSKRF
jgi:dihydrodipicolinate synthase/N-acetylneuraminate lyase